MLGKRTERASSSPRTLQEDEEGGTGEGSTKRTQTRAFEAMSFVRPTSSDAWFLSNSHRRNFASRKLGRDLLRGTSGTKISQVLGPLDISQLPRIAQASKQDGTPDPPARTLHSHLASQLHLRPDRIDMMLAQLLTGFNIMLYGIGDRMRVLHHLVESGAKKHAGAAVLVQGAAGRALNVDRLLDAIEKALRIHIPTIPPFRQSAEHAVVRLSRVLQRADRIAQFLEHTARHPRAEHPQRLFLALLAFDSPLYHTTRLHTLLHALARCPHIHIVASVSHVHAGLLLDGAAGAFSHGISGHAEHYTAHARDVRAPWLWHNVTTFIPPISEMLHSRGATMTSSASLSSQLAGLATLRLPPALDLAARGARGRAPGTSGPIPIISIAAALQVLNTITARARTLFAQLAVLQLGAAEGAAPDAEPANAPRTAYAELVRGALQEFTVSSDDGVKQLLGEMVDHGLVMAWRGTATVHSSHAIAAGDELSIPLRVAALEEVLTEMDP
ncbi:Origin recognition complex subunit 2 [Malassezia vespertilionis]|uniref:Origin recognition complex subunit 2 n=1 Tax=Malassezia vespertilionis TaxID=2020962 RepID=A0A2N1J804_9BASI|nr:Origin recognition complex subunit 2 [Malassezia vespertilionis]PKI82663.1 Orc2p [Malassezia vespertilionis]WFD08583.1 Origin recognition complex subunit 2 [Malassezia vespertilionis]